MAENGKRTNISITLVAAVFAAIITAFVGLLIDVKSDQSLLISRYDERTTSADAALGSIREELAVTRSARGKIREDISGIQQQISGLEIIEQEILNLVKQINLMKGTQDRLISDIGILRGLMKHHMLVRHPGSGDDLEDTFLKLDGSGPR